MEYDFPDCEVRIRVDDSWIVRAAGTASVVAHPMEFSHMAPDTLPVSVLVQVHKTDTALKPAAAAIMRPRVQLEELASKEIKIGTIEGIEFEWSDGILDIESSFFSLSGNRLLEIAFAAEPTRGSDGIRHRRGLRSELGRFVDVAFLVTEAAKR